MTTKKRPGVMFADYGLIGIHAHLVLCLTLPATTTISEYEISSLQRRLVEIKNGDIDEYLGEQIKASQKVPQFQGPFLHSDYEMDKPKGAFAALRFSLLFFSIFLACTVDSINQPDSSSHSGRSTGVKTCRRQIPASSSFTKTINKRNNGTLISNPALLFSSSQPR